MLCIEIPCTCTWNIFECCGWFIHSLSLLFVAGSLKNHQEVDMNVVRICFQASYQDHKGETQHLSPVLSEAIFDKSKSRGLGGGGTRAGGHW